MKLSTNLSIQSRGNDQLQPIEGRYLEAGPVVLARSSEEGSNNGPPGQGKEFPAAVRAV